MQKSTVNGHIATDVVKSEKSPAKEQKKSPDPVKKEKKVEAPIKEVKKADTPKKVIEPQEYRKKSNKKVSFCTIDLIECFQLS